jgi:hypothetical protein
VSKVLKQQLKNLQHAGGQFTARPEFVLSTREKLMRQMQVDLAMQSEPNANSFILRVQSWFQIFFPQSLQTATRPIMLFLLVIATSVAGFVVSASASNSSLPGDLLYNVKMATEKTQMVIVEVVGTKDEKTKMLAKHASNRAEETKELIVQNRTEQVDNSLTSLKEAVAAVSENMVDIAENNPEHMAEVAVVTAQARQDITDTLSEAIDSTANMTDATAVVAQVAAAVQDVAEQGVSIAQTLVDNQKISGLDSDATAKVSDAVKTTLDSVVNSITKTSVSIEGVINQQALNLASTTLATTTDLSTSSTSLTTNTVTNTSTAVAPVVISAPAVAILPTSTLPIVSTVKQAGETTLQQNEALVQEGRLVEAIENTKNITQSVTQVTQVIKETVIAPVVTTTTVIIKK